MTRRVTIRNVASLAGTSVSTVSASFNPNSRISAPTRERVFAAANRLGWRPDRRAALLRQTSGSLVGMIYEVNRPFQSSLVDTMYAAAAELDLDIILAGATVNHTELACLRLLLGERCDALVFTGSTLDFTYLEEAARMAPVLTLARSTNVPGVECVYSNAYEGQRLAVGYLRDLGHRSIGHIAGKHRSMSDERRDSYLAAMEEFGLAQYAQVYPFGDDMEAGIEAADMLVRMENRPTAVTCYNDTVAAGLVTRMRQRGLRVPEDISVVGYDNLPIAAASINQLTTIEQDSGAMCRAALRLIGKRISSGCLAKPGAESRISINPSLVERSSAATPPNHE